MPPSFKRVYLRASGELLHVLLHVLSATDRAKVDMPCESRPTVRKLTVDCRPTCQQSTNLSTVDKLLTTKSTTVDGRRSTVDKSTFAYHCRLSHVPAKDCLQRFVRNPPKTWTFLRPCRSKDIHTILTCEYWPPELHIFWDTSRHCSCSCGACCRTLCGLQRSQPCTHLAHVRCTLSRQQSSNKGLRGLVSVQDYESLTLTCSQKPPDRISLWMIIDIVRYNEQLSTPLREQDTTTIRTLGLPCVATPRDKARRKLGRKFFGGRDGCHTRSQP